jgi:hypothetical protein
MLFQGCSLKQPVSGFLCDFIVIFHLKGEPISPHLLRCSAFAVEGPQLHALRLASVAILARE